MTRQCTCIRCKAQEFIRGIYPSIDKKQNLLMAQEVVKTLQRLRTEPLVFED